MQIRAFVALSVAVLMCNPMAWAESLGVWGQTYPIQERDAIAVMKEAAKKTLDGGGREAMLKGAQERYLASLENVATPAGITAARVSATRLVDLTETVAETITDGRGRVVVAAGTKINPLAIRPLSKKVYFIDAKDPKQIQLVRRTAAPNDKVILLGGSVFAASKAIGRSVYLDVPGLHTKMRIRRLPSVVSQEGLYLKIQELAQ
ncbi:MAG: hypothetical protein ACK5BY_02920 [Limnohabitans sp.]|jgi:conjugal transfer pilus assembly protein TraW|uniref:hypothetical protein n=1 Tax=Limnohabitans sp. TaxID=1907725 RepID=UPI00391C9EAE